LTVVFGCEVRTVVNVSSKALNSIYHTICISLGNKGGAGARHTLCMVRQLVTWLANYHSAIFRISIRQTIVTTPLAIVWLVSHVSREHLILYLWATPCMEVWQTSNVRRLRLGEERKKDRTNGRMKIYMVCPITYGSHKTSTTIYFTTGSYPIASEKVCNRSMTLTITQGHRMSRPISNSQCFFRRQRQKRKFSFTTIN